MAFEKNMNDMKFLFLMLIGIPLIASTNIDCSGKSFHCLNSTHFMICADLGRGASYTVDDFVIPCPPPTECKASNRFECELPPSTTLAPTTASPVTTATFTKQKETTSEDVIVDTVSWNTVPEQHLELSTEATQESAIDTTVIPLQPVTTSDLPEIVNETESSIVTNSGADTLTTFPDQGIINIDIESATDMLLVTRGDTTTSIDSGHIVTSNIINENITNSANEKGTEMFSENVSTTEIVNAYETGPVNNTDVHLNVTVQQGFVSVATTENAILDSNVPVQSTTGFSVTERSAPTTEFAWLNDNEKLSEIITTTETVINETTVTNNIGFEVNVTGSMNNVDVHLNVTEQPDNISVATPEIVILDLNVPVQSTTGFSVTERSAPTTESAWVNDNEKLSEIITTTEMVINETTVTNNIGFEVNVTGSVNNVDVHLNVTEQLDNISVATPEIVILDLNVPVQSTTGFSVTERSAPTTESAWLNDNEKLSEIITTTETVINETTVTNNIGFEVNVTGSVNNVDVHLNVTEQLDNISVATPEIVILDLNVPVQSTTGFSVTERSAPTTVFAWLDDNEKLSEIITTTEAVSNETTVTNSKEFEANVTGSVDNIDVHLNVTEQQNHVSVTTPENFILDSNVPVKRRTSGLSLSERSAPTTVSAWLNDNEQLSEVISTTETNNNGFEVNVTGSVNKVDVHSNVTEQQDHVSVATPENVILDSNVPVQSTSGLSLTERSAPTTVSAWLDDNEKLSEIITTTETVINETTVTNNIGFEANITGFVNNIDVHLNVTEQQNHVSVTTPENFILDSNVPVQRRTSGLSLTERSAPTTVSAWLNDNEQLSEVISTTETNNNGFEVNVTSSVNKVDVHSNVTEQQDHVSVATSVNVILDSNVPVQSTSGLSSTERSAPTTVSAWLDDNEKLSAVISTTVTVLNETTMTNNIGFEVNETSSVNDDVHSNVTEQQDHVSVTSPENVIFNSNVPVQSTSRFSLTERSASTTEFARLNDNEKLNEGILTTETNSNGFEVNVTGSVNNVDVHSNVTEQQDHVSVATPENVILENVPVQNTSRLLLTESSAPTTVSAWLDDKEKLRAVILTTETVLNETTMTNNNGFEVNVTGSVNNVDVHSNVTEQQDHVSVATPENVILENVPVQNTSGLLLTESSAPTTVSVRLDDKEKLSKVISTTETVLNEISSLNKVEVHSNVTKQQDHVSVATPENVILENVPVQSTSGLLLTERSAPTTVSAWLDQLDVSEKLSEVFSTTETVLNEITVTNNIGFQVNELGTTVNNVDVHSNVTEQQDHVSVATPENVILDSNVPVQSTSGFSLTESSASTTELARLNDIQKLIEVITTTETVIDETTVTNIGLEMNKTGSVSNIDVHPIVTVQQDYVFVDTSENVIPVSNVPVEITAGLSFIERSAPTTESARQNDDFTNYNTFVTEHIMVASTDVQPFSTVVTTVKSNAVGNELATENFTASVSSYYTTESVKSGNETDFLASESILKSAANINTVPILENETSILILTKNITAGSENITNDFVMTRNEIENLPPKLNKNISDTLFTEASETSKNVSSETSTFDTIVYVNQYSENSSVLPIAERNQVVTEVPTRLSSVSNYIQNDTTVDIGTTLSTESMRVSVSKLGSKEKENAIITANSIYNSSDATVQNTGIKDDSAFNEQSDVVRPSLYTTPLPHENEYFIESSNSNFNYHTKVKDIGTDLTLSTESNQEVVNGFAVVTEFEFTSSLLDVNTENIINTITNVPSTLLTATAETTDDVNLVNNPAYRIENKDSVYNRIKKQEEKEIITTENIISSFVPVTIRTSDGLISSNLETGDENNAIFEDTRSIVDTSVNGSNNSLDHSKITNILQNAVVQQITTIPSKGQSNDMETPLDKDKINQSSSVFRTEQSNVINITQNSEGQLITSTSIINSVNEPSSQAPGPELSNNMNILNEHTENTLAPNTKLSNGINTFQNGDFEQITSASKTEQNEELEPITGAPRTERNYVITTIQKQQKGGNEQIMSVPSTERTSIFITKQTSGLQELREVISGPSSTKQSKTIISPTKYGFEQTISIANTEENNAQNAVIGQITPPSGTGQSHVLKTLLNDEEQATSTFVVKQNNTMSMIQNSRVDQIMALPSVEKNKLITGDNTVQYSGVNQIESVLGIGLSNHKIIEQNSIVKEAASDFYILEKNNAPTAKSYVSQNYLESSTIRNPLTNSGSVLNDYSNLQQKAGTNAFESDVTEYIRLSSSKSATNSQKSTNTPEQTAEIQINYIRYTDSTNNMKQNGTTNIIQKNGVVEARPLNFLEKDSVNKKDNSETKLVRDSVPIYFSGTTGAELNEPNIMGTHKLLLAALPYENIATATTEFLKNNEPLVTLSASTSATTRESILEREESGYTIASNPTFLSRKTTPYVVESEPNTLQSHEGNSRSVFLENPIEINTQAYEDNSNSGLVSKIIFTEKHVVAATASTTIATKLSEESQQSSQVNVPVTEEDKICQDGITQQSTFAVTSTPLEKKHIDNGLTVKSTSSFMEVIQTTHIPLVVEVTTKMTAAGTSATSKQESNSTYKPFDCRSRSTGKYADNNDCSKFYICSGTAQLIIGKCPINTVFSEIRKQCTRNLSHCIRNNELKCMISGRFADYIKPNIYYICVKKGQTFLKYKLQCQEGYLLNRLTVTCYKNLAPVNQSISSDSSQNTTEKITKEIEPVKKNKKSKNNKDFECDYEGKFPDPYNCRGYYICKIKNMSDETYYRKYKKCDEDEVFHKEKKKCVDASSYECRYCDSLSLNVYYVRVTRGHHFIKYKLECQESYYLNATEVRCDKILKASNANKISKNILQESSKSNSHNHKNKKRFKCQEEGQFVDPNDCRKYYLCQEKNNSDHSDSEQRYRRKHRKCSKHEVYNTEIQACAYSRNMSCLYN